MTAPRELSTLGRAEVARYGVANHPGRATGARRVDGRIRVDLEGGGTVIARRLVVTTGLVDELPPVAGLAERWGRDVIHCPYCHGWEVRDRVIGVLVTSPLSLHPPSCTVRSPPSTSGTTPWWGCVFADGRQVDLEVLVVAPRFVARSDLLADLGLRAVEHPSGSARHVPADAAGQTDVAGVWVAGNVTDPMAGDRRGGSGHRAGAAVKGPRDTRAARPRPTPDAPHAGRHPARPPTPRTRRRLTSRPLAPTYQTRRAHRTGIRYASITGDDHCVPRAATGSLTTK